MRRISFSGSCNIYVCVCVLQSVQLRELFFPSHLPSQVFEPDNPLNDPFLSFLLRSFYISRYPEQRVRCLMYKTHKPKNKLLYIDCS